MVLCSWVFLPLYYWGILPSARQSKHYHPFPKDEKEHNRTCEWWLPSGGISSLGLAIYSSYLLTFPVLNEHGELSLLLSRVRLWYLPSHVLARHFFTGALDHTAGKIRDGFPWIIYSICTQQPSIWQGANRYDLESLNSSCRK